MKELIDAIIRLQNIFNEVYNTPLKSAKNRDELIEMTPLQLARIYHDIASMLP